jgi:diguanylate cyclase (GGDEF)-like protein
MAKMGEMAGRGEMGEMTPLLPQSWATVPARLDPLTCLPDRAALVAELERAIVALRSGRGAAFALLFIDLDQFKQVNDRWGHLTGDGVLEAIARRLRSSVRPGDLVARLGGDEFAALLREVSKPRDAAAVAERICRQMATPIDYEGETLVLGASIGVAMSSPDVPDPATILKRADRAMYQAKARGGGGYAVWE